jgi:putative transcriptional regulator
MQANLIESVCGLLQKQGFSVKALPRTALDIVARKGSTILVLKVLQDANSLSQHVAHEMKNVAGYVRAAPLIIAATAGDSLADDVVYRREGITTLSLGTFASSLRSEFPVVVRTRAGYTAQIDGNELRSLREEYGWSTSLLSRRLGVSKNMVAKYEQGASVREQVASRLADMFGETIFRHVDVFDQVPSTVSDYGNDYVQKYGELGFDAATLNHLPFDLIAKQRDELILTEIGDSASKMALDMSEMLEADNLVIFDRKKPKDVPALRKEEFLGFEQGKELVKFLKEF